MFHVNPLHTEDSHEKRPYFLPKIKVKNQNVLCCNFCLALLGLITLQWLRRSWKQTGSHKSLKLCDFLFGSMSVSLGRHGSVTIPDKF